MAQTAFDALKATFLSALGLDHLDPKSPFQVETDASNFAIGVIMSQPDGDGTLHLVAFYSRKHVPGNQLSGLQQGAYN